MDKEELKTFIDGLKHHINRLLDGDFNKPEIIYHLGNILQDVKRFERELNNDDEDWDIIVKSKKNRKDRLL